MSAFAASALATVTYDQAQKALDQQERRVTELRERTGTVLATAALTASFFGAGALSGDGVGTPGVLAGAALAVTVLSGLYVLYPHELRFASDARRLYDHLKPHRDDPERLYVELAFGLRRAREWNGRRVDRLARCLTVAVGALVIQVACWAWAIALL